MTDTQLREGLAALRRQDYRAARARFEDAVAPPAGADALMLLAYACRGMGDLPAEEAAVDRALGVEPAHVRALIAKGDCRQDGGDVRAATSFYRAAIAAAGASIAPLHPSLAREIERARAAVEANSAAFLDHLENALRDRGFGPGARSPRFQASLDIMTGKKAATLQLQQPTSYFFPDLPQRAYYDPRDFDWADAVEAESDAIRAEFVALASEEARLKPYMTSDASRPRRDVHGLIDNPEWSTLDLTEGGVPIAELADAAPRTFAVTGAAPLCRIANRAPSILFSVLRPGARIPPHTGVLNTRLICHLPLIVPSGCGFRVAQERREWHEGELLIFDDSIEHEAWNDSGELRTILIFDVWRPEITTEERGAIVAMFEAIDGFGLA